MSLTSSPMANSDLFDVKKATIEWRDNAPFCTEFDDVYYRSEQPFSENGLKETDWLITFFAQPLLRVKKSILKRLRHEDFSNL